jgi:hypothetical protein
MSSKLRLFIAAAGVCVMPKSAIAISPSLDTLRSGTVTDTVRALSDTSQTYAPRQKLRRSVPGDRT